MIPLTLRSLCCPAFPPLALDHAGTLHTPTRQRPSPDGVRNPALSGARCGVVLLWGGSGCVCVSG